MTTLPTSRRNGSPACAFTLLELLLVITMMALLTSIALPRFSGLAESMRLDEGADGLASMVRHGRIESAKRGLKVRLEIREKGTQFRLSLQDAASTYRESYTDFDDAFLDTWHTLPSRVYIASVMTRDGREDPREITFHPNGFTTATEIVLQDARDRSLSLQLGAVPREVRVEKPNARVQDGEDSP